METSDRVMTAYGEGTILTQEFAKGILSHRYCIKLDECPNEFIEMQSRNGGIYILDNEFEVIEKG